MKTKLATLTAVALVLPLAWGCASDGQGTGASGGATAEGSAGAQTGGPAAGPTGGSTTSGGTSGGTTTSGGTSGGTTTSGGTSGGGTTSGGGMLGQIPSLVSVNLQNVLNDLSIRLKIDRANIPVNAQIPIAVAANVCGVSINILSVSTGGQAQCTARTASAELAQSVQQQISAGGNVGGGAQGGSTVSTSTGSTTPAPTGTQAAPTTQPAPTTTSGG